MPQTKQRTISYFRASWASTGRRRMTLEKALDACLASLPGVPDTRMPLGTGLAETRHRRIDSGGVRLHVAAWTDGEEASIVPHATRGPNANLASEPPPSGSDYLDGDGMALVSGNHCLLLPSGLRAQSIENYIRKLLVLGLDQRAKIPKDMSTFALEAIARGNVVRQIEEEGIKGIHLNLAEYLESGRSRRDNGRQTILQKLGADFVMDFLTSDEDRELIENADNIDARLVIRILRGGRSRIEPEDLAAMAEELVKESIDEIELETGGGKRIKRGDIVMKKAVDVDAFAKTVHHQSAWDEMDTYFRELSDDGKLAS